MTSTDTIILDKTAIQRKIKRVAYQIAEQNYDEDDLILIGVKNKGDKYAKSLAKVISSIADIKVTIHTVTINKKAADRQPVSCDFKPEDIEDKAVIMVDDVANTGRTLFYALQPLMKIAAKKVQVAVLVDRKHKGFPICSDFVGLSLSTTMQEHITVEFDNDEPVAVYLS